MSTGLAKDEARMRSLDSMNKLWPTAVHEAGHAVVGRVMGQACGAVSIVPEPEDGCAGHAITYEHLVTMSAYHDAGRWREEGTIIRGRIITFMAGRFAEELIIGACGVGDGDDQYQVAMMIDVVDPDADGTKLFDRLSRFSHATVRRHRLPIEALATQLLERKAMSEHEVTATLRIHLPRWEWPPRATDF